MNLRNTFLRVGHANFNNSIAVELDPRMASEVTKRVQGKPEAKRLEVGKCSM